MRQHAAGIHLVRRNAGVVEGAIQLAVGGDDAVQHGLHLRRDGYVTGQGDRLAARRVDHGHGLPRRFGFVVGHRDPRTLSREGQRRLPPDAVAAAGHQGDLAVQHTCHCVSPNLLGPASRTGS